MPRRSRGARVYQRPDTGLYVIRDGGRYISTGTRERRAADAALAEYIMSRDRPATPTAPETMTVAAVLDRYLNERTPHVAAPERIAYAVRALIPILGRLPISHLTGSACRRYAITRGRAPGTTRKELQVLQASINHCVREGYLTAGRQLTLPPPPPARDRWLTRLEVAALLRAAYRSRQGKHLARYILIAVYTGTRSGALLNLRFMPHVGGGWIDTEKGILYRRATDAAVTKKRQTPAPIPPRLLAHLRRWERLGATWAVEAGGQRVASVKTAWKVGLRESGIEHATRHDLRHTCATWMMQAGADTWAAAGYLGMTVQMLERVYGHHHPNYLKSAVLAIGRRMGTT